MLTGSAVKEMFCTKCGAVTIEGERFCLKCGAELQVSDAGQQYADSEPAWDNDPPFAGAYGAEEPFDEKSYDDVIIGDPGGKKSAREKTVDINAFTRPESKRSGTGAIIRACVILALLAAVAVMSGYVMGSVNGSVDPDSGVGAIFGGLFSCGGQTADDGAISESDIVSESDAAQALPSETVTTAEETTTTTETTTATTVNSAAKEAERIRGLLISKTWTTSLEGYNADVKFYKDGTADITVKVLFVTKTIKAQYLVNDACKFVIQADYEGNNLGISGDISAKNDNEITVNRDGGKGTVTLKAK